MAGSRCATPSASTPTSSRATRSAASADSVDTESTHKKKQSRQKSLVARSSAAGKHASRASSVPPSPLRDAQSSEMLLDAGETSSVNNANKQKLGCSSSDEKQNICVCVR